MYDEKQRSYVPYRTNFGIPHFISLEKAHVARYQLARFTTVRYG